MSYRKTCQYCGTYLDPGDICDCRGSTLKRAKELLMKLTPEQLDYVIERFEEEEAAQSATNTQSSKAEQNLTTNVRATTVIAMEV